jgi:nicotinamidase-related amidase
MDETRTDLPIDPDRTALVVVDAQKAFSSPDGVPVRKGLDPSMVTGRVPAVRSLVETARTHDLTLVFTRSYRRADGRDAPQRTYDILPDVYDGAEPSCCAGTVDVEYAEGIEPGPDEFEVTKKQYDAFNGSELEWYLRTEDVDTLLICGFMTNVCVESTARSAHERAFNVVVVRDCCGASSRDAHEAALANVERILGATATSDDIGAVLST